jgi:hypothetical protein
MRAFFYALTTGHPPGAAIWWKTAGPQTRPWGYLIPEDLYIQVGAR